MNEEGANLVPEVAPQDDHGGEQQQIQCDDDAQVRQIDVGKQS
jgi:hypothetical protein